MSAAIPPTLADQRARVSLAALALALGLVPSRARASPPEMFGLGARSSAMAGLGATFVDDWAAVYANPAGLARARTRAVTLGLFGAGFQLRQARGAETAPAHSPIERARALVIGVTLPIPLPGAFADRLALGVAFQLPFDVIARHRLLRPEVPRFVLLENRAQSVVLAAGAGLRLPWGLRVGAGAMAGATLSGSLSVANDAFGTLGYSIDDRIVVTYAPIVGASWDHERSGLVRVGAVFRGALTGGLDVRITARDLGLTLPPFNVSGAGQYDPWQVALELAVTPGPWLFAVAATFKRWSEYPGPLSATTAASRPPPPVAFADTLAVRAGAEYRHVVRASFVAVRAGYLFEPSPLPEQRAATNYQDNDRHVGSLGLASGARLGGTALSVEAFGQLHVLPERTHTKDPAAMVPADNPGAPTLRAGGVLWVAGVTTTLSL